MKKFILITWIFSIILISCKKSPSSDNSNPPLPPLIEIGPNTVIIDNSTSQTVQSIDSTHVVFDGNTDQLQRLVAGNIIVSSVTTNAPAGFLRKIIGIQRSGTVYNILTSEATLLETFKNLHIDDSSQTVSFTPPSLSIILKDNDGNNNTIEDQIKIKLTYNFSPKLKVKIDIENFQLKYSKISGNFLNSITKEVTVGRSIGIVNKKIDVVSHPIAAIIIPGTPIVIVPTLRISVGADLSVNVELVASDTKISNIETYIEYKNSNWNTGFTRTMDNQFNFSGINGNVTAKVYVEPAIDFKLWGSNWAKGSITAQGYLKASGQLLPTPDCELKAGISAGVEANLKFFGLTFVAASYPDIFDFSKVLYTCSAPNTQLPTLSTTPVTGITNTSATSGGNITNSGVSAVTVRGVCWGTSPHPTTSNNITTNGSGIGSFNSSLMGLLPNTTYYLRAYATNSAGTGYGNEIFFIAQQNQTLPNPEALWSFDNCTANDFSGNNHHGQFPGGSPLCQAGVNSNSACFSNNSPDYFDSPGDLSINSSSFSISYWVKFLPGTIVNNQPGSSAFFQIIDNIGGVNTAIRFYNYTYLTNPNQSYWTIAYLQNGTDNHVYTNPNGSNLTNGNWHHFALSCSNGTVTYYLDGNMFFSLQSPTTIYKRIAGGLDDVKNVCLDQVRYYNSPLTLTQIQNIYISQL